MLTKRSLVFKFSARAGTDLELKTKVCPSFMLFFSFFASGVWEAQGFICTAHRGLNRHAKRESLAQTCIASQGETSNLNKKNIVFFIHVQTEPATERQRAVKGDWVIKILLKFLLYYLLFFALFPVSEKNPTQRMARSTPAAQASLNL